MTDAFEAAVLALDAEFDKDPNNDPSSHQLVRAVIAAYTKAVSGEAVACRWKHKGSKDWLAATLGNRYVSEDAAFDVEPLFAAPPLPAVRVKPLVWETHDYSDVNHKRKGYISRTIVGKYVIADLSDLGYFEWLNRNGGQVEKCDTLEAAKAAAQADYEARILSALESAPLPAVPDGFTHRHKKRGTKYRLLHEGKLQVSIDALTSLDNAPVVIYQGEDGQIWVRPSNEFLDGRFELLPAAPEPEGAR